MDAFGVADLATRVPSALGLKALTPLRGTPVWGVGVFGGAFQAMVPAAGSKSKELGSSSPIRTCTCTNLRSKFRAIFKNILHFAINSSINFSQTHIFKFK